ncbi:thioredoxin family protein [Deinococcus cellulosilyticus]|uniref:Thioredoxin n=1 Tax=Deinococcus cellulosilyticus (strain DSM 18568 / NBRC 106333 / KACC 11606 / 5516J-15) TaxID=1223518 RepID=A0A511N911_DEIC1|nr:thioredoxin family protein [Deinococcus cellulosilyticus]GEM49324.1 hypothetical protein DC3_49590 [Deinococcus cellulosilyticus NBRC 106333 = KACC 11606]
MADLTPETYAAHIQHHTTLVLFHKEWSAESRQMHNLLESLGLSFHVLSVERHLDFCDGLGVYSAPQLFFYHLGELRFRLRGLHPAPLLLQRLEAISSGGLQAES